MPAVVAADLILDFRLLRGGLPLPSLLLPSFVGVELPESDAPSSIGALNFALALRKNPTRFRSDGGGELWLGAPAAALPFPLLGVDPPAMIAKPPKKPLTAAAAPYQVFW